MVCSGKQIGKRAVVWGFMGVGSLLALQQTQAAPSPPQAAEPIAAAQLAQLSTQWLNQFGQAEIALTDSRPESPLRGARLALLLPWYQREQQLLFTQWGIVRADGSNTLNLGIGQRWFTPDSRYWGYNLFYDYRFKEHHQRLGVGLERRSNTLAVAVNGYLPLSAERLVDNNAHKVRPAHGVDVRLQQSPPNLPHWRFNLVGERYWGHQVVPIDQQPQRHPTAVTFGLDYTPLPLLTAGYGFKLSSGGQRTHQLQLNLNYHLGVSLAQQLDPQQVAASHSLTSSRLALVQRNSQVVLQQQPNDAIQLTLPSEESGTPGKVIEIKITLKTPRPLDEWQFSWEGDLPESATPQINAHKDGATLTLPTAPGAYTLRLIARHTQRGVVAYSNKMVVQVVAPAPAAMPSPTNPITPSRISNGAVSINELRNNTSDNNGDGPNELNHSQAQDTPGQAAASPNSPGSSAEEIDDQSASDSQVDAGTITQVSPGEDARCDNEGNDIPSEERVDTTTGGSPQVTGTSPLTIAQDPPGMTSSSSLSRDEYNADISTDNRDTQGGLRRSLSQDSNLGGDATGSPPPSHDVNVHALPASDSQVDSGAVTRASLGGGVRGVVGGGVPDSAESVGSSSVVMQVVAPAPAAVPTTNPITPSQDTPGQAEPAFPSSLEPSDNSDPNNLSVTSAKEPRHEHPNVENISEPDPQVGNGVATSALPTEVTRGAGAEGSAPSENRAALDENVGLEDPYLLGRTSMPPTNPAIAIDGNGSENTDKTMQKPQPSWMQQQPPPGWKPWDPMEGYNTNREEIRAEVGRQMRQAQTIRTIKKLTPNSFQELSLMESDLQEWIIQDSLTPQDQYHLRCGKKKLDRLLRERDYPLD